MATVKHKDFVEIGYTGRLKEGNAIFDTTEEKVAKENDVYDKDADYSPMIICIGQNQMIKGLEEQLINKETGKEYKIEISSENAFGRKNPQFIQLIPANKFRQQNIQPVPGLQLNIDGVFGVVKTVSGGRCLVDFNHPLAGKNLIYEVRINRIVDDVKEQLNSLLKMNLHIKDSEIEIKDSSANITLKHKVSKGAQEECKKLVSNTIQSIKTVNFAFAENSK